MSEWVDCGTYWLNLSNQGSPRWKDLRVRVTASNFAAAAGLSTFSTPDELADEISGIKKKEFTPTQIDNMNYGTEYEPMAREWYSKTRGVVVEEVGIAIPKWDPLIGGSLDGNIVDSDGCIEVKCPKKMYAPLKNPPKSGHSHIWKSHYAQMQGCMAITDKKWCDYIVFCPKEDMVYVERIPFDKNYWEKTLYPLLTQFLTEKLLPRLDLDKIIYPPKTLI